MSTNDLPTMSLTRAYPTELVLKPGVETLAVAAVLLLGSCSDSQESYVDALVQRWPFHDINDSDRKALYETGLGKMPKAFESLLSFDSIDWGSSCNELILTKSIKLDPTAVTNQIARLRTLWLYKLPLNELSDWLAQYTGLPARFFCTERKPAHGV